jgi:hypothetical protein
MEASHCFDPPSDCNDGTLALPILEYGHVDGRCSVTGGYRYRGERNPNLRGTYLFGDFCTGEIWGAREMAGGTWEVTALAALEAPYALVSFGEDADGEVYVLERANGGRVHRLVDLNAAGLIFSDGFDDGSTGRWSATAGDGG